MSLTNVISPMKFELVKAAIATLVATERDNQLALAQSGGANSIALPNDYNFNVFLNKFNLPDAEQLPCVNFYNLRGSFDTGKSYTDSKWHTFELGVDLYSISAAEPDTDADELAAARLDYLWAQVFHTLMAEENWYKGLKDVVREARFTSWRQGPVSSGKEESAAEILAIQAILELQFEEPTETLTGEELKVLAASLEIDDQLISPFVNVQIT